MAKQSAGLLAYRQKGKDKDIEVLLVHPGGPFWAKKDKGAWSIPKGEFNERDEPLTAAKREFEEETGHEPPTGELHELGSAKNKSGKVIYAWAVSGDLDASNIKSNSFKMEWPPRSGKEEEFLEVDKAGWFSLEQAFVKLNAAQTVFIERLAEHLHVEPPQAPEQTSLL